MKKTATILALASLSMASNSQNLHGSFRKPLITLKPETLHADDEFQIIGGNPVRGGSRVNDDPRYFSRKPSKPQPYTPPTNPKVWLPRNDDVRLYGDDELQIIGGNPVRGGSRVNDDPRYFSRQPSKPQPYNPPTNPKVWFPRNDDVRLYGDDELQIIGGNPVRGGSRVNDDPRYFSRKPSKPQTYTPPTNPKVWFPRNDDVRLYGDDELQIIGGNPVRGGSRVNDDPRYFSKQPSKPQPYTPPTNPKVWFPRNDDVKLYNDDADDELVLLAELLNDN